MYDRIHSNSSSLSGDRGHFGPKAGNEGNDTLEPCPVADVSRAVGSQQQTGQGLTLTRDGGLLMSIRRVDYSSTTTVPSMPASSCGMQMYLYSPGTWKV